MKASLLLRKARARIEDPARWCMRTPGNVNGQCCAGGAVAAVLGAVADSDSGNLIWRPARGLAAFDYLDDACRVSFDEGITVVNDHRGHAAVMEMYDIAISAALSDEAAK